MTDYISRKAAIAEIMGQPPDAHYPSWYAAQVKKLPAADVRPVVHGHWEESPMNGIVCSECGRERPLEPFGETEWNSDFCPWCGADMREDKQE